MDSAHNIVNRSFVYLIYAVDKCGLLFSGIVLYYLNLVHNIWSLLFTAYTMRMITFLGF